MNYVKAILSLPMLFIVFFASAQHGRLTKIWETDSTLKVPESVLYYSAAKVLLVSNIDGKPNEKDLKGSISKVGLDGKIIQQDWVVNLSAPKGMGIYGDKLYVADLAEVVVVDIKTAKISMRIPVKGAIFLNDITIDKNGIVYVSDSQTGKVHRIQNSVESIYIENKMGVNGLLSVNDNLYLAVKDTLYRADKNKKLEAITTGMDESSDGIVQNGNDFIVSCWNGVIYSVKQDGSKQMLLDTRDRKSNTADIGFDPASKTLYVPTFSKNKVVAYQVN
jgi:hypothetical protein